MSNPIALLNAALEGRYASNPWSISRGSRADGPAEARATELASSDDLTTPPSNRAFPVRHTAIIAVGFVLASGLAIEAQAQVPQAGEVRQLVTFRFLPGKSGEALAMYREQAVPLYERNEAMLSFRGLREVESPVPLDIIIVSAFDGMAGMDASNTALRSLAEAVGSSIGAIYGGLGALSQSHDDQFVEMLPRLGNGDATAKRLVALVWYQVEPGARAAFENALADGVAPWELHAGIPSATGRFLVSDGWSYLRFIGFDSLAAFQDYWSEMAALGAGARVAGITTRRREVILASVPELSVR